MRFTIETFDIEIVKAMLGDSGASSPESLYKTMALYMGSFLMPKFVNKGLQLDEGKKVVLKDALTGKFTLTNKSSSFLKELKMNKKNKVINVDIYGDKFIHDL